MKASALISSPGDVVELLRNANNLLYATFDADGTNGLSLDETVKLLNSADYRVRRPPSRSAIDPIA